MSENNTSKPRRNPNAIYWIYGIIALAFVAATFFAGSPSNELQDINTFYQLADSSMVRDVKVVNHSRVDFYLKKR